MSYATTTEVPIEKSKMEIEATVRRYGADGFISGWEGDRVMVQFRAKDRYVRFLISMPARTERRFVEHSRGRRSPDAACKEWEQGCRQRWRALALMIKAKFVAVESGIVTFEQEFFPHITMPDGRSVYEVSREGSALAYSKGEMRPLLPPVLKPSL